VSEREETTGRRVVVWMYVAAVGVAGIFGYVLGEIVYGNGGAVGPSRRVPSRSTAPSAQSRSS